MKFVVALIAAHVTDDKPLLYLSFSISGVSVVSLSQQRRDKRLRKKAFTVHVAFVCFKFYFVKAFTLYSAC